MTRDQVRFSIAVDVGNGHAPERGEIDRIRPFQLPRKAVQHADTAVKGFIIVVVVDHFQGLVFHVQSPDGAVCAADHILQLPVPAQIGRCGRAEGRRPDVVRPLERGEILAGKGMQNTDRESQGIDFMIGVN